MWLAYVFIPIFDFILPLDHYNLPENRMRLFEKDKRFLIPLYSAWFADFMMYFYALYLASIGRMPTEPGMFLVYVFCIGNSGALNLSVGHELVHRRELVHKILGNLVYSKMLYSHFIIQHIKSHHKKVATPEDPSTARKGESVWQFCARSIPSGYIETWHLEKDRLTREGKSAFNPLQNKLIFWNILHLGWVLAVYLVFGMCALVFQLFYSFTVIIFFEAVNYIEHYGLERKLDHNGNYESISTKHSWNAP